MAFFDISSQLGIPLGLFIVITVWETLWTGLALWRSARNKHTLWFVVFLLINLFGIPEIIYLFVTRKKKGRNKKK